MHGPAAGADIAAPVLDGQQGVHNPQANPDEGSGAEPQELPVEPQELPVEPAAPEILEGGVGGGGGEGDDQQWNGMEWDRAADELTWERLLGKMRPTILCVLFFLLNLLSNSNQFANLLSIPIL